MHSFTAAIAERFAAASTLQGGAGVHRGCVPGRQNQHQVGILSTFFQDCSQLGEGDPFVVRIEGGCAGVPPPPAEWIYDPVTERDLGHSKRQTTNEPISITDTSSELENVHTDDSSKFVALRLDELQQGQYSISVAFNGTADRLTVVDYHGREISA